MIIHHTLDGQKIQLPLTTPIEAVQAVLRERERELLALKGPCSNKTCELHYAHSGPCS